MRRRFAGESCDRAGARRRDLGLEAVLLQRDSGAGRDRVEQLRMVQERVVVLEQRNRGARFVVDLAMRTTRTDPGVHETSIGPRIRAGSREAVSNSQGGISEGIGHHRPQLLRSRSGAQPLDQALKCGGIERSTAEQADRDRAQDRPVGQKQEPAYPLR